MRNVQFIRSVGGVTCFPNKRFYVSTSERDKRTVSLNLIKKIFFELIIIK